MHILARTPYSLYGSLYRVNKLDQLLYSTEDCRRKKRYFHLFSKSEKGADFETEEHRCYTHVTLSEAAGNIFK